MADTGAELDVVDVLRDRRRVAAHRTVRVAPEFHLRELARERVVEEQPADEGLADPERELERLRGLNRPDHAGQHAEHAALGAAWRHVRRRRLWEEAAVARPVAGLEDRRLPLEA